MRRTIWLKALFSACLVAVAVAALTAFSQATDPNKNAPAKPGPDNAQPAKKDPGVKKVAVGKNVSVEIENKKAVRVLVEAYVCLRKGVLEHLLTRRAHKEHESILAADIDARDLHAALLLAGAEIGEPVVFKPNETAPWGTTIKITLAYKTKEGNAVKVPARQWIRHIKTKLELPSDWVFAGSGFVAHKDDPAQVFYLANDGDVICVSNFEAALLDVPFLSSNHDNEYEAHTERIPPEQTPVLV